MMRGDVIQTNAEIFASASVVGGKESEGPLGNLFDLRDSCDRFGMKTWEKSEKNSLTSILLYVILILGYLAEHYAPMR